MPTETPAPPAFPVERIDALREGMERFVAQWLNEFGPMTGVDGPLSEGIGVSAEIEDEARGITVSSRIEVGIAPA